MSFLIPKDEVINWLLYSWGQYNSPLIKGSADWGWTHQADDFEKVTKVIIEEQNAYWTIDGVKYTAFDMLEHFPNLQELQIRFSRRFSQIKPVPKLKEIKTLTLLGDFDFSELLEQPEWEVFSGLTQIKFSSVYLTKLPNWIYQHTNIESLEINSCASLKPDLTKLSQAENIQELILSNHIRNIYDPEVISEEIEEITIFKNLTSGIDELSWLEAACSLPNLRKFATYNLNYLDVPMPLLTSEKLEELIIFLKDSHQVLANNQQDRQKYYNDVVCSPGAISKLNKSTPSISEPRKSLDKSSFGYAGLMQTPERSAAANIACRTLPILAQSHSILPNLKTLAYVGEIEPQAWQFLANLPNLTHLSLATKSNFNQLLTDKAQLSPQLQSLKLVDLREHDLDTLELRKQLHTEEHTNWVLQQFNQNRKPAETKSATSESEATELVANKAGNQDPTSPSANSVTSSQLADNQGSGSQENRLTSSASKSLSWVVNFDWLAPLTNLENLELLIRTSDYPAQIGNLTKLKRLVLRSENFRGGFPESWAQLSQLEYLEVLEFGELGKNFEVVARAPLKELVLNTGVSSQLSPSVSKLTQLEKLVIFGGRLLTLPQSLGNLSQLRELQLFNTKLLTALPERLTLLSQLEKLEIISSGLKNLPDNFKGFKNLREFRIEDAPIEQFPSSFGNNPNLEKLTLNELYSLVEINWQAEQLTNLKELNFYNSCVVDKYIFSNFPNLMVVRLDNLWPIEFKLGVASFKKAGVGVFNFINQVIFEKGAEHLRQKYNSDNAKKSGTKGIKSPAKPASNNKNPAYKTYVSDITDQHLLNFSGSQKSLRYLSTANLNVNTINQDLKDLENLIYLNLHEARYLRKIPDEFGTLKNLRYFKIHGASNLEDISANLGQLSKLQYLDLSVHTTHHQNLDFLADLSSLTNLTIDVHHFKDLNRDWNNLQNLEVLHIIFLRNKQLPEQICDLANLKTLGINTATALTRLPDNFNQLTQLKDLSIKNSSQISLSGMDFSGLRNLEVLVLTDLNSINLPVGIDSLPNLEEVTLVNLPKLIQFSSGNISLPKLKKMWIYGCRSLKSLGQNWLSTPTPQAELIISDCHRLIKLPVFGGVGNSSNQSNNSNNLNYLNYPNWGLKRIYMDNCNSLEEFPQLNSEASALWEKSPVRPSAKTREYSPGALLGFSQDSENSNVYESYEGHEVNGVSLQILGENKISRLPSPSLLKGVTSLTCHYKTYEQSIKNLGTASEQVYDEVTDLEIDYLGKSTTKNTVLAPLSFANLQNLKILDLNPSKNLFLFQNIEQNKQDKEDNQDKEDKQKLAKLTSLEIYFSHNLKTQEVKPTNLDLSGVEELKNLQSLGLYNLGNKDGLGFNLSNTQIKNLTLANCPYLGAETRQAILDHGLEKLYLLKVNPEVYDERLYHPDSISVNGQKQSNTLQNRVGMIISCTDPNDQRVWFLQNRRPLFVDNLSKFINQENILRESNNAFINIEIVKMLETYFHEQYGIVNLQVWNRNND